jgi:hypothetical protein
MIRGICKLLIHIGWSPEPDSRMNGPGSGQLDHAHGMRIAFVARSAYEGCLQRRRA